MELAPLLEARRKAVLGQWFQLVIETYPSATAQFLGKQQDQFRNPVGHAISEGLGRIYDQLLTAMDADELADALDGILRIRSIQDFTPTEAVSFVFDLKVVIRKMVEAEERAGGAQLELTELDSRIDRVALLAFEKYTACREKLNEIRISEIKKRMIERLHANNTGAAASMQERRSACDEV